MYNTFKSLCKNFGKFSIFKIFSKILKMSEKVPKEYHHHRVNAKKDYLVF